MLVSWALFFCAGPIMCAFCIPVVLPGHPRSPREESRGLPCPAHTPKAYSRATSAVSSTSLRARRVFFISSLLLRLTFRRGITPCFPSLTTSHSPLSLMPTCTFLGFQRPGDLSVSSLESTLVRCPLTVDSKGLTGLLTPLDATLTQKLGQGVAVRDSNFPTFKRCNGFCLRPIAPAAARCHNGPCRGKRPGNNSALSGV
jgi:hypothetical protein